MFSFGRIVAARRLPSSLVSLGSRADDEPDLLVRKRTAVAVSLVLILSSVLYGALGLAVQQPSITVFSLIQIAALGTGLVILHRTGRLAPVVVMAIAVGLLVLGSGQTTLGGMAQSNGNLAFGLLVPLGAVLMLGRRAAVPGFIAFVALILWAAVTDPIWRSSASPIPDDLAIPLYAGNLLVTGAVALGLVVYIDGERLQAKRAAETLLLNILPRSIVDRLRQGERVIADQHRDVTVLFTDVVDFTQFAEAESPARVVALLNELFTAFDDLAVEYGAEKIKTIGDAYMAVAGVPSERSDHAEVMVRMAIAMHQVVVGSGDDGRLTRVANGDRDGAGRRGRHRPTEVQLRPVGRHGQHGIPHGVDWRRRLYPGHGRNASTLPRLPRVAGTRRRGRQGQGRHADIRPGPPRI